MGVPSRTCPRDPRAVGTTSSSPPTGLPPPRSPPAAALPRPAHRRYSPRPSSAPDAAAGATSATPPTTPATASKLDRLGRKALTATAEIGLNRSPPGSRSTSRSSRVRTSLLTACAACARDGVAAAWSGSRASRSVSSNRWPFVPETCPNTHEDTQTGSRLRRPVGDTRAEELRHQLIPGATRVTQR